MSSNSSSRHSRTAAVAMDPAKILTATFLQGHVHKRDLMERLRCITQVLQEDESIDAYDPDFPGLNALCHALIAFVDHSDKQVRLFTVVACMELFAIYAPDAPWDTQETLQIFQQTIRQLANLGHTASASQSNYHSYLRILQLLADIKIGVVLVDLAKGSNEEALQVLADLVRTILQAVRNEHPAEVAELIQRTISACLEEYYEGTHVPIPLLDQVLLCVGMGKTVLVLDPAKAQEQQQQQKRSSKRHKKKAAAPSHYVEQPNPSYLVAASVLRKSVDRLSTPIAALLNGLWNGDAHVVTASSIHTECLHEAWGQPRLQDQRLETDVWNVVYELHTIAPPILTTVIGTVTGQLPLSPPATRVRLVQLLGACFGQADFAAAFSSCVRAWMVRVRDKEASVRHALVEPLVQLTIQSKKYADLAEAAQEKLIVLLTDADVNVRSKVVHTVCNTAFRKKSAVSAVLLQAVAHRVTSKHKQERRDTLTGLSQMYYKHFMADHLKPILAEGEDCPLEVIVQATHQALDNQDEDNDRYGWIPQTVVDCASFTDAVDTEMHSRVCLVVDDLLVGSSLPGSDKTLSATARAVGVAWIVATLQGDASPILQSPSVHAFPRCYRWMDSLLQRRAQLQQAVSEYLDWRSKARALKGKEGGVSEEALHAQTKAEQALEQVAGLTAPPATSATYDDGLHPVVQRFHACKDQHVFRILSTIATPTHSPAARVRALEELPKRVQHATGHEGTAAWVKALARRTAMGDFMNASVVYQAVRLAHQAVQEHEWEMSARFLAVVQLAAQHFPALCGVDATFEALVELFSFARSHKAKELKEYGITTALSGILAAAAPVSSSAGKSENSFMDESLRKQLLNLCCKDGTPEQARHAVRTMASFLNPKETSQLTQEQHAAFEPLLQALTAPSRLRWDPGSEKVVAVLAALAELAECAPSVFDSTRGQKAIGFALNQVLLGRGWNTDGEDSDEDDDDDDFEDKEDQDPSPSPKRRSSTPSRRSKESRHSTPGEHGNILEDLSLSRACRRLCAAMELLTSYVRSSTLSATSKQDDDDDTMAWTTPASKEVVEQLFGIYCQVIQDGGLPPSTHDSRQCRLRQDRAALRQSAAVNLLRLCDARLGLEGQFLTVARWHVLAQAVLDDEKVVREHVLQELASMLTGTHAFAAPSSAMAPSLRFLALVTLATDGDHGSDHSSANGNAANVGKQAAGIRQAVPSCIRMLRNLFNVSMAHYRSMGETAIGHFETKIQPAIMPEYSLIYAFHLLCFRKETPLIGKVQIEKARERNQMSQEEEAIQVADGQTRVLCKRLKMLINPLIESLGDSADNISFLMRMTEVLSKHQPLGMGRLGAAEGSTSPIRSSLASHQSSEREQPRQLVTTTKLGVVCEWAKGIILDHVKTDANFSVYPGRVLVRADLYALASKRPETRVSSSKPPPLEPSQENSIESSQSPRKRSMDATSSRQPEVEQSEEAAAASPPKVDSAQDAATLESPWKWQSSKSPARKKSSTSKPSTRRRSSGASPMLTSPGGRQDSRVHFSPEPAHIRTIPRKSSPSSSFGEALLSPIPHHGSPQLVGSEEKTVRASLTQLSIPTATQSSLGTSSSQEESVSQASSSSLVHKGQSFSSMEEEDEEAPPMFSPNDDDDDDDNEKAPPQVRPSPNKRPSPTQDKENATSQKKQRRRTKSSPSVPTQIRVTRTKVSLPAKTGPKKRSTRTAATPLADHTLDFLGEEEELHHISTKAKKAAKAQQVRVRRTRRPVATGK